VTPGVFTFTVDIQLHWACRFWAASWGFHFS
jgi:hypothetical protein